jgi:hypothetical protein
VAGPPFIVRLSVVGSTIQVAGPAPIVHRLVAGSIIPTAGPVSRPLAAQAYTAVPVLAAERFTVVKELAVEEVSTAAPVWATAGGSIFPAATD